MRSAAQLSEDRIPQLIPLRDFFRNPEKTAYQISPSGGSIAFLSPYENPLNIWVQSARGGEARRITSVPERDSPPYFFKSNHPTPFSHPPHGAQHFHYSSPTPPHP